MVTFDVTQVRPEVALDMIPGMHLKCFDGQNYEPDVGGHHAWWLAWAGTRPAAFAGIRMSHVESTGYLCRAGVLEAYRGHGLQRRLIKVRLEWARKRGLERVVTDTVEGNLHSANNLIASGFRLFEPAAPWGINGSLYWFKELT